MKSGGAGDSAEDPCLEVQHGAANLVIVSRRGAADLGRRLVQLRLVELHDGNQAQVIAGLGQAAGSSRLLEKAGDYIQSPEGGLSVEPGHLHVIGNSNFEVSDLLCGRLRLQVGLGPARGKQMAVKHRNADIESNGSVM